MGAVLDLPASAAPFTAEARRESFYIGAGSPSTGDLVLQAATADDTHRNGRIAVPRVQVAAFATALYAVARHPNYEATEYVRRGADPWTVTRQDDVVVFGGPVITFGVGRQLEDAQTVEIEYQDLEWLRTAVATVSP